MQGAGPVFLETNHSNSTLSIVSPKRDCSPKGIQLTTPCRGGGGKCDEDGYNRSCVVGQWRWDVGVGTKASQGRCLLFLGFSHEKLGIFNRNMDFEKYIFRKIRPALLSGMRQVRKQLYYYTSINTTVVKVSIMTSRCSLFGAHPVRKYCAKKWKPYCGVSLAGAELGLR